MGVNEQLKPNEIMPSSTKNCVLSHPTSLGLDQTLGLASENTTVTTPATPQPPRVTPGDRHQDAYLAPCQRLWREASRSIRRAQISAANEHSKVIGSLAKSHLMNAIWCKIILAYLTVNIAISCNWSAICPIFQHHWLPTSQSKEQCMNGVHCLLGQRPWD